MVKVGADGKVSILNASATAVHVIVDIQGYVIAGTPTSPGAVVPISPTRVLDTQGGLGAPFGGRRLRHDPHDPLTGQGGSARRPASS